MTDTKKAVKSEPFDTTQTQACADNIARTPLINQIYSQHEGHVLSCRHIIESTCKGYSTSFMFSGWVQRRKAWRHAELRARLETCGPTWKTDDMFSARLSIFLTETSGDLSWRTWGGGNLKEEKRASLLRKPFCHVLNLSFVSHTLLQVWKHKTQRVKVLIEIGLVGTPQHKNTYDHLWKVIIVSSKSFGPSISVVICVHNITHVSVQM